MIKESRVKTECKCNMCSHLSVCLYKEEVADVVEALKDITVPAKASVGSPMIIMHIGCAYFDTDMR